MKKLMIAFLVLSAVSAKAQDWNLNIKDALAEASKTNKKVILFFTVAEQCENCEKLEENIWKSKAFAEVSKTNYVLVKIDFSYKSEEKPNQDIQNQNLLIIEKYNKDGFFPLVVVLNKEAKVLGKTGIYKDETPAQFISLLKSFEKT